MKEERKGGRKGGWGRKMKRKHSYLRLLEIKLDVKEAEIARNLKVKLNRYVLDEPSKGVHKEDGVQVPLCDVSPDDILLLLNADRLLTSPFFSKNPGIISLSSASRSLSTVIFNFQLHKKVSRLILIDDNSLLMLSSLSSSHS